MSSNSINALAKDVRIDAIPADLRALRRWVAWKVTYTKVPICPRTGHGASHSNPSDWTGFDEALDYAIRQYFAGVMIALGDGLAGADHDKCYNAATGTLEPWAAENVALLCSYTEISPSSTGVKTIVYGTLPPGRRRKDRLEMYDQARFFTVTGQHLAGTPTAVHERTAELAELHRRTFGLVDEVASYKHTWQPIDALPGDLRKLAESGRIRRSTLDLLDSAGPDRYNSASEADAAIAAGLIGAGLTADEALTLLLDSARGQDALRRKGDRHGEQYWQRTVAHAAGFVGPVIIHGDGPRGRLWREPRRPTGREVTRWPA